MSRDPVELGREVVDRCRGLGFALAGVAEARPTDYGPQLRQWLGRGRHGSMAWLAERVEVREDPARVLPGARSVIVVADRYARRGEAVERPVGGRGRIARYARGRDYHKVIKKRLHRLCDEMRGVYPDAAFRAFTDTAPVLEREHAARAGLGWIGKHTLLIDPTLGSYLLLGGVLTTLDLRPEPGEGTVPDHCGTCTRCIDACPTDAIGDREVDATRCISYLTIERRDPIDQRFYASIGDWIFGCDICQEVCPHNSARPSPADRVNPEYEPRREGFDLLEVLGWSEEDRRAAFAGTALTRARLEMIKRNALIALANDPGLAGSAPVVERVRRIASDADESPMVRRTARDVLGRLGATG